MPVARLILMAAPLLAGCKGFWNAPPTTPGTGSTGGVFYVLNQSGNPTLMTSADGGYTYTFGLDGNGYALFPLSAKIFPNLNSVPNYQWIPGQDYVDEGTQIRSLNNVPFPVAPYFQGINPPAAMTASVQPVIQPPQARILIPIRAVLNFAQEGGRNTDLMGIMQSRWDREWAKHTVAIRKHLRGQRRLAPLTSGSPYGAPMQGFGW